AGRIVFSEVIGALNRHAKSAGNWITFALFKELNATIQLDNSSQTRRNPIRTRVKSVCDGIGEAEGGKRIAVQAKEIVHHLPLKGSHIVKRKAVSEIDQQRFLF